MQCRMCFTVCRYFYDIFKRNICGVSVSYGVDEPGMRSFFFVVFAEVLIL